MKILKLKSFTLIEIVVVMAISAFVVIILLAVYDLMTIQFLRYKSTNEKIKELYQLTYALQNDFEQARIITSVGEDVNFEMKNNVKCTYTFNDKSIIREINNITDTFKIDVINLDKLFSGLSSNYGIIDELNIESNALGNKQNLNFYKKYESDVLIEQEKLE